MLIIFNSNFKTFQKNEKHNIFAIKIYYLNMVKISIIVIILFGTFNFVFSQNPKSTFYYKSIRIVNGDTIVEEKNVESEHQLIINYEPPHLEFILIMLLLLNLLQTYPVSLS